MARYIDADKFLQDEIKRCGCVPLVGSCTTDNESLAYRLAKAPAADVVEDAKIREDHLKRIIDTERTRHKAYEQIVKGHSAYIAILLDKLGATKDNAITITAEEVAEALKKYETRGIPIDGGFSLYCEVIGE